MQFGHILWWHITIQSIESEYNCFSYKFTNTITLLHNVSWNVFSCTSVSLRHEAVSIITIFITHYKYLHYVSTCSDSSYNDIASLDCECIFFIINFMKWIFLLLYTSQYVLKSIFLYCMKILLHHFFQNLLLYFYI